ncbi:MAG: terminase family protein [Elusimicrobia bacterium]|nr:terminase family protein [Elusimicrobiota bacterium]
MKPAAYFLPYQIAWLKDKSRIKIWEKSRRIGATYVQSYEDVRDCVEGAVPCVWFSSADESAGREYILYCEKWAKIFNAGAQMLGEIILDEKKGIKGRVLEFKDGRRITALTSNPKAFRSKGGKVILDEYAHHDDADEMWKAAKPCITWGFPLRILSTHNGTSTRFNRFIESIRKGRLNWSLHTVSIFKAVEDGLADKIVGHVLTKAERDAWIEAEHQDCDDEDTWQQEYCVVATDSASSFLPYNLIRPCEFKDCLVSDKRDLLTLPGDLYAGFDVARKKHLAVIAILQKYGGMLWLRWLSVMQNQKFKFMKEELYWLLKLPQLRRGCIDATGLGMQLGEEAQDDFGKFKVEPITFNEGVKEELAYGLHPYFEDVAIHIPDQFELREDLHSVKKIVTKANHIRFDAEASENGHGDRFWAMSLAAHAISKCVGPIHLASGSGNQDSKILQGYEKQENGLFLMRPDHKRRKRSILSGF